MKKEEFFISRPIYWALAGVVASILAYLGLNKYHVRDFVPFQFTVLALAAVVVAFIMITYIPGERITRDPLDDDE